MGKEGLCPESRVQRASLWSSSSYTSRGWIVHKTNRTYLSWKLHPTLHSRPGSWYLRPKIPCQNYPKSNHKVFEKSFPKYDHLTAGAYPTAEGWQRNSSWAWWMKHGHASYAISIYVCVTSSHAHWSWQKKMRDRTGQGQEQTVPHCQFPLQNFKESEKSQFKMDFLVIINVYLSRYKNKKYIF